MECVNQNRFRRIYCLLWTPNHHTFSWHIYKYFLTVVSNLTPHCGLNPRTSPTPQQISKTIRGKKASFAKISSLCIDKTLFDNFKLKYTFPFLNFFLLLHQVLCDIPVVSSQIHWRFLVYFNSLFLFHNFLQLYFTILIFYNSKDRDCWT